MSRGDAVDWRQGFQIVRYKDVNERVFKTISLEVPEGGKVGAFRKMNCIRAVASLAQSATGKLIMSSTMAGQRGLQRSFARGYHY